MKKRAGAAVSECGVGGRRAFAAGRRRALSLGLSLSLALSLSGCATVPGPKDTPVDFTVESVRTEALDQHRYRFSVVLSAFNRGSRTLEPLSASCALFLGGDPAGESLRDEPARIPSGEKADFRFEFDADLRELGGAVPGPKDRDDLPWEIRAELRAPDGEDGVLLGAARSEGSCPLVREPELVIRTIVLVKHELINVLLELVLEVRNPNAFPVEFSSASYQFYGEGARWANGSARKAVMIPAFRRGTAAHRPQFHGNGKEPLRPGGPAESG